MQAPFQLLFVCTGNICRSPYAELLLRERLGSPPFVAVASLGTSAAEGAPIPEPMIALATARGLIPGHHRGTQATAGALLGADLIIALDRHNRGRVVSMAPRTNRYTVTLREFGRLAQAVTDDDIRDLDVRSGNDPAERLRGVTRTVLALRGSVAPPPTPEFDDVVDPFGLSDAVYRQAVAEIEPAVETLASLLGRAVAAP
ncbi:low molecular weight phosphatase family protein [Frondihabitans sp. 4ASC-45]|uniref:arsenate reductase/protein-tyrosine-phosphatase family protein n=1 Tax=Frondihabitans sp. 4ASC-45 TaxID=3111636 RepID=UPI003C16431C